MNIPIQRASIAIASLLVLAATAATAFAEDYQCTNDNGCEAVLSDENGSRKVKFRKGDIVSTGSGWVVNPSDGWSKVD